MNLFDDIINKRARQKAVDSFTLSLDALGYPYELLDKNLTNEALIELYQSELEKGNAEGFCPVFVPDEERLFKAIADAKSGIFAASSEDASPICNARFSSSDEFSVLFTEYTKSFRITALIRLPSKEPWQAAALIPFCGSNDGDIAAVLKHWNEKYGAFPAAVTHDAIELFLPEPLDEKRSVEAARDMFAFSAPATAQLDENADEFTRLCDSLSSHRIWKLCLVRA